MTEQLKLVQLTIGEQFQTRYPDDPYPAKVKFEGYQNEFVVKLPPDVGMRIFELCSDLILTEVQKAMTEVFGAIQSAAALSAMEEHLQIEESDDGEIPI